MGFPKISAWRVKLDDLGVSEILPTLASGEYLEPLVRPDGKADKGGVRALLQGKYQSRMNIVCAMLLLGALRRDGAEGAACIRHERVEEAFRRGNNRANSLPGYLAYVLTGEDRSGDPEEHREELQRFLPKPDGELVDGFAIEVVGVDGSERAWIQALDDLELAETHAEIRRGVTWLLGEPTDHVMRASVFDARYLELGLSEASDDLRAGIRRVNVVHPGPEVDGWRGRFDAYAEIRSACLDGVRSLLPDVPVEIVGTWSILPTAQGFSFGERALLGPWSTRGQLQPLRVSRVEKSQAIEFVDSFRAFE